MNPGTVGRFLPRSPLINSTAENPPPPLSLHLQHKRLATPTWTGNLCCLASSPEHWDGPLRHTDAPVRCGYLVLPAGGVAGLPLDGVVAHLRRLLVLGHGVVSPGDPDRV